MASLLNPTSAATLVWLAALAILVARTDWDKETYDLRQLFKKHHEDVH